MCTRQIHPAALRPARFRLPRLVPLLLAAAAFPLAFCASTAVAWQEKADSKTDQEQEIAQPEQVSLETLDGVTLAATYYAGPEGKQTVPVILLHMFKGSSTDYAQLAPLLQKEGHSVLVPDLRGHGDSTTKESSPTPLQAAGMPRSEFLNMVRFDMPRLKQYLIDKNNAGKLNIEKLCVVGAEMGASVALNWTAFDWSILPEGAKKQGQDVKAIVLISPEWSTPGLPLRAAMTTRPLIIPIWDDQLRKVFKTPEEKNFLMPVELDFRQEVSVLIVVGQGKSKAVSDAKRLYSMLKHYHPDPPEAQRAAQQDLFYGTLDTTLQGTKMLGVKDLDLEKHVIRFIQIRAVERSFPWKQRKSPYE